MYMLPVCRRSLSELKISVRTMLKDAATLSCPGRALLNRFCHAGTVVGWLMLMVQSPVQALAGVDLGCVLCNYCPQAGWCDSCTVSKRDSQTTKFAAGSAQTGTDTRFVR